MPEPRQPGAKGRTIPEATREYVFKRDGGVCIYCGQRAVGIDHIVPWTQGGSHHPLNLAVCCSTDNSIAGERVFTDIEDKIVYVRERRKVLGEEGIRRVAQVGRDV